MKSLEQYKAENKQLLAQRLALRGLLENQGQAVDMAQVEQIGERLSRFMREDRAGDFTIELQRPLAAIVTAINATLEPITADKLTILKPTSKREYDGLSQADKKTLMQSMGSDGFMQMLSDFNSESSAD